MMENTHIVAENQSHKRTRYEQIGRTYALSGKQMNDIDTSNIFDIKEKEMIKKDIEDLIISYDNMLSKNQTEIDKITALIENKYNYNENNLLRINDGLLVTIRELLTGLLVLLINIGLAAMIIDRQIILPGIYKFAIALLSPVIMVFLSSLTSYFIVKEWQKIRTETMRIILYIYFSLCAIFLIPVLLKIRFADVLLYLISLLYPVYLLARTFIVSNYVEKNGYLTNLKLLRIDIEKKKSDCIAELNNKLSNAIEENIKNEKEFWLGYASGNSLT